jgi:hypothetical protein
VLLFTLLNGYNSYGQTVEKSRKVTESFKIDSDTEVEIINKYGNIHLIPWDKDSIRFEIELMVRGTKQSKVDKSYDYIEFDFKTTKYYIIAQTLFAGKSSFWSDVSDLTGAIFNSSTKTKIDYTVYFPDDIKLKVVNKYGNIYTTDHSGELEIELSNGDLKAHHLAGRTKLTHEFGDANIKQIDDGELNISYGELHLENAEKLTIESKSSKLYIHKVSDLDLNSRRDKYYLNKAGYIRGLTNFSLIEIDELTQKLNLTSKYGDVVVKNFSDEVESFKIEANDADITLHFIDNKYYKLDATVDDRTEVMYSADIKNISSKELGGDEKLIEVKCFIGTDKSLTVPVKMDVRAGSVSLKLK